MAILTAALALPTNIDPASNIPSVKPHLKNRGEQESSHRCPELDILPVSAAIRSEISKKLKFTINWNPDGPPREDQYAPVVLLGSGESACAYGLQKQGKIVAVAKAYHEGFQGMSTRGIEGLKKVDEFFGTINYDERLYIIMEYIPGVHIYHTKGWRKYVSQSGAEFRDEDKDVEGCIYFLGDNVYQTIRSMAFNYAKQFGIWHDDLFFANIFFNPKYTKYDPSRDFARSGVIDNQARAIDWDQWYEESSPEAAWNDVVDALPMHKSYYDERGYPLRCRVPEDYTPRLLL